jgi:hypothetical protein
MGGDAGDAEGVGHTADTDLPPCTVNAAGTGAKSAGGQRILEVLIHGELLWVISAFIIL